MTNKEKCKELFEEYFTLAARDYNSALVERGYGDREKANEKIEKIKSRLDEIESDILDMINKR